MRMVIGVIVGISFAVLVLLGIIALVCWHKYNNTKEQDILKKYAKLLHQLEYLLYFDLLISLISVMVYASSVLK